MKALIISHTPVTTYEAMGKTFLSLFKGFERHEMCQLYIYPSIPDVHHCQSYFRMTDKDILKSYYRLKVQGREINPSEIGSNNNAFFENPKDVTLYKNRKNRNSTRILLRDLMWKMAPWNNKALHSWIRDQNPTCIFVAPGNAKFLYDIAMKISKEYALPMVTYICDEFYFIDKAGKWLDKFRIRLLQKKMRKLMERTSHIVTICDNLKELYANEFDRPTTTLMTGTGFDTTSNQLCVAAPQSITYMGNIRYDRYISLVQIGKAIQQINEARGTDFSLNIYTGEKDPSILSQFSNIQTIRLCGYVTGEEFKKVFFDSHILLHTEAFDEKNIDAVKNSVSTKIADCLGSGIPLVAYGPAQIASMRHLIDNECAIVATSPDDIYTALETAFFSTADRENAVRNALMTAQKYHATEKISAQLHTICQHL